MKSLFPAILIFICQSLFAQRPAKILVSAGQRVSDIITPEIRFFNKDFKTGHVSFYSGTYYDARLNYDLFNGGNLVFIAAKGDTLAIVKDQLQKIKSITIDTNKFVCSDGCMLVVSENRAGSLAKKQQWIIASREKIGAYNVSSSIDHDIDAYTSLADQGNNLYNLIVRENITFQLKTEYFISDQYNHIFLPANRKNLEKLFFNKKAELNTYFKQHEVNFNNENDLTSLLSYLGDLS